MSFKKDDVVRAHAGAYTGIVGKILEVNTASAKVEIEPERHGHPARVLSLLLKNLTPVDVV